MLTFMQYIEGKMPAPFRDDDEDEEDERPRKAQITFGQYIESRHGGEAEYVFRRHMLHNYAVSVGKRYKLVKNIFEKFKDRIRHPKIKPVYSLSSYDVEMENMKAYHDTADAILDLAERDEEFADELAKYTRNAVKYMLIDKIKDREAEMLANRTKD